MTDDERKALDRLAQRVSNTVAWHPESQTRLADTRTIIALAERQAEEIERLRKAVEMAYPLIAEEASYHAVTENISKRSAYSLALSSLNTALRGEAK